MAFLTDLAEKIKQYFSTPRQATGLQSGLIPQATLNQASQTIQSIPQQFQAAGQLFNQGLQSFPSPQPTFQQQPSIRINPMSFTPPPAPQFKPYTPLPVQPAPSLFNQTTQRLSQMANQPLTTPNSLAGMMFPGSTQQGLNYFNPLNDKGFANDVVQGGYIIPGQAGAIQGLERALGIYGEQAALRAPSLIKGGVKVANTIAEDTAQNYKLNPQGGFARIPGKSPSGTEIPQNIAGKTSTIPTSSGRIQEQLAQEARKYMSAEEFGRPLTASEQNKMIDEWEKEVMKGTITPNQRMRAINKEIGQANRSGKQTFDSTFDQMNEAMGGVKAYKNGKIGGITGGFPSKTLTSSNVQDKNPFSYSRETLLRNIEDTFKNPEEAGRIKQYFHDPIVNNETNSIRFQNQLKESLGKTFKLSGIGKGSKEDYAAADFIEGKISLDGLKKAFPTKWQGIAHAAEEGRAVYKDLLTKVNSELAKFGYSPIPERQNYVTHTQQIQTWMEKYGSLLNGKSDALPTEISGINLSTKPGKQFFKFGLKRQGGSTHEGLITALEKYIPSASTQIHHTADIQRGRALQDFLQKSADPQSTKLSNFNSYLSMYVDELAGKQNIIDRPVEKVFGRKALSIGNGLKKRLGANMVGGNLSSAATNFIPFTQSLATTSKPAAVKGLYEAALAPARGMTNIDGVESAFLTRRFPVDNIAKSTMESVGSGANTPFKLVDGFTSRSIVGGKYFEGISKGLSKQQAMNRADEYAARVLADRSLGQTPLLFNSKTLGAFTQFQLEVNNQVSFLMKDVPKNMGYSKAQVASALTQFVVYSYLFNNMFEKVTGRRPQIDPINAGLSLFQGIQDGKSFKDLANPVDQNSPVGQIAQNLPFTSILTGGRIPLNAAMPDFGKLADGDIVGGVSPTAYNVALPFGGSQIKKSVEGATAFANGASTNANGNIRFPIEQTPTNLAKSVAFGQYSTPEARDYFKNDQKPLSDKQSELLLQTPDKQGLYQTMRDTITQKATENKAKDEIIKSHDAKSVNGKILYWDEQSNSVKEVDPTQLPQKPPSTGDTLTDRKLESTYNSQLQSYVNAVALALKSNAVDKNQAIQWINNAAAAKTTSPKDDLSLQTSQYSLETDRLKRNDDFVGYIKAVQKQITALADYQKTLDPNIDKKEIIDSQNKIEDLMSQAEKYISYGGFKKPRKAPKITIKMAKIKTPKATLKKSKINVPTLKLAKAPTFKVAKSSTLKLKKPQKIKLPT